MPMHGISHLSHEEANIYRGEAKPKMITVITIQVLRTHTHK